MQFLIVVCVLASFAFAEKYTTKYDNIDLQEIIKSDRLTTYYFNCLMGKKPCSTDGQELKNVLPDALKTDCSKCSDKQKEGSKIIIQHLYKNKPEIWKELTAFYDPTGIYEKKYADQLKKL